MNHYTSTHNDGKLYLLPRAVGGDGGGKNNSIQFCIQQNSSMHSTETTCQKPSVSAKVRPAKGGGNAHTAC